MAQDWPPKFRKLTPPEHAWQAMQPQQSRLLEEACQRVDRWTRSGRVPPEQRDEVVLLEAKVDAWAEYVGEVAAGLQVNPPHTDQPTSARNAVRHILMGKHPDPWALEPVARSAPSAPSNGSTPAPAVERRRPWRPLEEAGIRPYDHREVVQFFKFGPGMLRGLAKLTPAKSRSQPMVYLAYCVNSRPCPEGQICTLSVEEIAAETRQGVTATYKASKALERVGLIQRLGAQRVRVCIWHEPAEASPDSDQEGHAA